MKLRTLHLLVLAGALALIVAAVRRGRVGARASRPTSPLALVPPGPAFVMSVDVARVRASPTARTLARAGLTSVLGTGDGCAFDPVRDLSVVVVSAAGEESAGTAQAGTKAALIASGTFSAEAVARCAVSRLRARGKEPHSTQRRSFTSVRDPGAAGELAVRDGLLVVSDGIYLERILEAAEGKAPEGSAVEAARDRLHVELRRTFGKGAPLVATLLVPPGWLVSAFGEEAARSPLATLRSAALRTELGDRIGVGAFLGCESAEGCVPLEAFIRDTSAAVAPLLDPSAARLLARVVAQRKGERIELELELGIEDVTALATALQPSPEP